MKKLSIFMLTIQIIYFLSLPLWFLIWFIMFLGSYYNEGPLVAFIFVVTSIYPVAAVVCSIMSWRMNKKGRARLAFYVCLIPLIFVLSFIFMIQILKLME